MLRKSDESAYTIVPSRLSALTPSIWSHTEDSVFTEASESSLVYRELAFDDDLFTARVYKRNYRGREVRKVKQEIEDDDSPNKTPTTLAVSTTASNAPRTGVSHSSSATDVFELPGLSIPPVVTAGQWVVTGWMVRYLSDRHPSRILCPYVGIPGPVVTRTFFEYHCLSDWKKVDTGYLKLDGEDVIQNINWRGLFETSVDIPPQWLYHCFIAACFMGKEELIRLILQEDPDVFLTPLYFYDYRHPVELAFHQGHIHIVKMLLRLKPSAMDSLHHLGRYMIRSALRAHDNELLAEVLMQDAFDNEQICDDQKHTVHLAHQNGSQTCLGSLIVASTNLRILKNPDRSAFRYLASTLPPDVVIVARLPLSVGERREIIRTIIMNEALVRCSHHGFEWHLAYDTAVQGIADYLMLQDGLIHVGELGVETYSCLINTFESHFPEIVRRPGIMASLEAMQRPQPTTSLEVNLALSPRGAGTDAILSSRRKKISRLFVGQSTTGPPVDQNKTNSVKSNQAPDLTEGCLGPLQREKTRGFAVLEKQRRLISNISFESSRKELIDKYEFSRYVRYQL